MYFTMIISAKPHLSRQDPFKTSCGSRNLIKSTVSTLLALCVLAAPTLVQAAGKGSAPGLVSTGSDCPSGTVRARLIGADAFERAGACEGLARAHAFFVQHGFSPATDGPTLTFKFEPEVRIACSDILAKPGCKGARVAAFFDAGKFEIVTTKASSSWMRAKTRPYFKLSYDRELYVSVLAHEATHALSKQFYRYAPSTNAQDEYIAYASQISTMGDSQRTRVLSAYPTPKFAFSDEMNINDLVHHSAPHAFGVMSWRHFTGTGGGRAMLDRIYSGDFKPPSMDMP